MTWKEFTDNIICIVIGEIPRLEVKGKTKAAWLIIKHSGHTVAQRDTWAGLVQVTTTERIGTSQQPVQVGV